MEAGFNITDVDIPSYFAAYGVAPKDPSVEVFVKVIVDVKGSPFDPDAEITVKMV
jgi:hypothetical protein